MKDTINCSPEPVIHIGTIVVAAASAGAVQATCESGQKIRSSASMYDNKFMLLLNKAVLKQLSFHLPHVTRLDASPSATPRPLSYKTGNERTCKWGQPEYLLESDFYELAVISAASS